MKQIMITALVALGALLGVARVAAQDTVTSVNAVGMVKTEVARGTLELLAIPMELFEGVVTAEQLFGDTLPYGTTIFLWNGEVQNWQANVYQQGFFGDEDKWSSDEITYERGQGLFLQIPQDAPEESYPVVLSGEVPSSSSLPEFTKQLTEGNFYLVGFTYPVEITISDENFGINPSYGDAVFVWNPESGYQTSIYQQGFFGDPDKWSNPDLLIKPGQGFFLQTSESKDWTTVKDDFYAWP